MEDRKMKNKKKKRTRKEEDIMSNIKSLTPLRYPGGKSKVVKKLLSGYFPEKIDRFY